MVPGEGHTAHLPVNTLALVISTSSQQNCTQFTRRAMAGADDRSTSTNPPLLLLVPILLRMGDDALRDLVRDVGEV